MCFSYHEQIAVMTERTLVCLIGDARGSHIAWDSLYKHVLDPLCADLALLFGKVSACQKESCSLYSRAKYVWEFDEPEDWGVFYDQIANEQGGAPWRDAIASTCAEGLWGGVIHNDVVQVGSGAITFVLRYMLSKELRNIDADQVYTTIILTRSDHLYLDDHPKLDNEYIWVPHGEDWWGVTDRHHVFSSSLAMEMLSVAQWFLTHLDLVKSEQMSHVNTESVLLLFLRKTGLNSRVRRFNRCMATVSSPTDATRWRTGTVEVPGHPGLKFKYPHEYYSHVPRLLRTLKFTDEQAQRNQQRPSFDTNGRVFALAGVKRLTNFT